MRDVMRDIMSPPDHLTIVQAGTMIIITGADGRTTRLSPDGKKIKDESTKIERKTVWTDGKLVSEISGLGQGKVTETYSGRIPTSVSCVSPSRWNGGRRSFACTTPTPIKR